jgi:Flp pilus assembly protein TadD
VLRRILAELFGPKRKAAAESYESDPLAQRLDAARARYRERDLSGAEQLADALIAEAPELAAARVLKADILRRTGRLDEAMASYRRALVLEPGLAGAWLDLGVCHYLKGDPFWARVFYRFANALEPDNADAWNELGVADIALGNYEQAEQSLENAVNRKPEHPEAWNNFGLVVARRGALADARRHFLRALFLRPDYYMALCNLGLVCHELERFDEAESALRRALALQPHGNEVLVNLGTLLLDAGRTEEARPLLERACVEHPSVGSVWAAASLLHFRSGELQAAEAAARRAIECDPADSDARLALAHAQLSQQRFAEGWENYEARADSTMSPLRKLPFARWRGEDPRGLRLLVYGEQGLGDEIMFASCIGDLLDAGADVTLHCEPRLRGLFARAFPQARIVQDDAEYLSDAGRAAIDRCVPVGSLPRVYRRSERDFPRRERYLSADPALVAAWRARLHAQAGARLSVGLVWRGGLAKTGRAQRSLTPQALAPLLRTPGVHWVVLQRDANPDEISACGEGVSHWPDALRDLDQTAALLQALDLVISACSTVVHLGGALGCRVWVLTPIGAAWRYPATGDVMPWYANVKLVRQSRAGEWDSVVAAASEALRGELMAATARAANQG